MTRERVRVVQPEGGRVLTKQAMRDETDVRLIVRKFHQAGVIPRLEAREPWYGDFSNVDDYLTALNRVRAAQEGFEALPAAVRDHVDNDPGEFVRLVTDPERRAELVELGLVSAPAPDPEAPAVLPAPAPPAPGAPVVPIQGGS